MRVGDFGRGEAEVIRRIICVFCRVWNDSSDDELEKD
jgi:hypothetical protein